MSNLSKKQIEAIKGINTEAADLPAALGITKKRMKELRDEMADQVDKAESFVRPAEVLKLSVLPAKTVGELIMCTFLAGSYIGKINAQNPVERLLSLLAD